MRSLSMTFLAERVYRTILRHSLLPPGTSVIVALSGGADSTALACLLVDLAPKGRFHVVGAAHYNHRLRGPASDEDEAFCLTIAEQLGLHWRSGAGDVRAFAKTQRTSIEDASRRLRYGFLRQAALELGASRVAVGHTRDDQAETVLLQMLRGAGPRGLRGMSPDRELGGGDGIRLVRPLLDTSHAELVSWLGARGQAFREDDSNRDPRYLRNRVRNELIPFLEARVSPSVTRVLARDAVLAGGDADYLDGVAREAYSRMANAVGDKVELDREALLREPLAIRRRIVLLAVGNLRGAPFVGFDQVDRVLALTDNRIGGPLALPGARASLVSNRLVLEPSTGRRGRHRVGGETTGRPDPGAENRGFPEGMNFSRCELSIPGEVRVPGTTWVVSSSVRPWTETSDRPRLSRAVDGSAVAIVDASRVSGLAVRTRRPGDWFRPLNLGGRKKLQDYFVDRKVPRSERDRVPIVVDARDRIVWVAGHGIDEEFRVSGGTRDVVILKLRGESA